MKKNIILKSKQFDVNRILIHIILDVVKTMVKLWCVAVLFALCINFGWYPANGSPKNVSGADFLQIIKSTQLFLFPILFVKGVCGSYNIKYYHTDMVTNNPVAIAIKTVPSKIDRAIAIHESAHSVIARKLGLAVVDISIDKKGNSLGRIVVKEPEHGWGEEWAMIARIKTNMAGVIAERVILNYLNMGCTGSEECDLNVVDTLLYQYVLLTDNDVPLTS